MCDQLERTDNTDHCAGLLNAELLRQYRRTLEAARADPTVATEFESWWDYVRDRHGDVFAGLAIDATDEASGETDIAPPNDARPSDAAYELFVETLTFDFLLTRLLDAVETTFGCSVRRPLAADAAVPFAAEFEAVHEHVRARLSRSDSDVDSDADAESDSDSDKESDFRSLTTSFVESASAYDVARLHRESVSPLARRAFGRYDTPAGVAELAVETLFEDDAEAGNVAPDTDPLIVDPGCGAGAFLAAAADRLLEATQGTSPSARLEEVIKSVRGFDVSPTAVRASRLAILLAMRPLLEAAGERESNETPRFTPRVVLGDAALATAETAPLNGQRADYLLMNPPWLTWDSLSERVKDRWRRASEGDRAPDLFPHRGLDARLGFANDDLSVPYTIHCLHRLLRDGGRASVVLKRDLITGPAGKRLRDRSIADRTITYDRVHDFGALGPFSDVDAGTALFGCRITADDDRAPDQTASSPAASDEEIPMTRWQREEQTDSDTSTSDPDHLADPDPFASLATMRGVLATAETRLVPADPEAPASPWIRAEAESRALGPCSYRIRHGVKDDAKAVYGLDRDTIERRELESTHVYPYLKSKHIVKYGLFGHDLQLVPQRSLKEENEAELRRDAPSTYAYLEDHRDRLLDRSSSWFDDGPFYSLFGLGPYTWADYKVVWCRLGFKPHFAVVSTVSDPTVGEKTVVPGDHCMFVGTDDEREAHYLCALLNSAPYQRSLRDISSGGKSSLSKSTVERLALPEWTATSEQRRLAELSQRAHEIVPQHVDCSKRAYNKKTIPELAAVQSRIDREVEAFLVDFGES